MNELIEAIRALTVRTKAGRLRALMPIIEDRLAAGVAQKDIVPALREGGIDLTLGTFKSYLHRHRVKSRNQLSSSSRIEPEPAPSERSRSDMVAPVDTNCGPTFKDSLDVEPTDPMPAECTLADILDARKSEALTDQYMNRSRPLFGRNRS